MAVSLFDYGTKSMLDVIPGSLREEMAAAATRIWYSDEQQIHARGDLKPGLSIVRDGAVRVGNLGIDGAYITTAVLGPGQSFGEFTLFADLPRTHDARAVGETSVDQISRRSFEILTARYPTLQPLVMSLLAERLHAALEFIDDLKRLPLKVLLAKVLILMSRSSSDEYVRTKHSDLGAIVGTSRVSVAKALAELQSEGFIKQHYGRIQLNKKSAMETWIEQHSQLVPLARSH